MAPADSGPDPAAALLRRWQESHDADALDRLLRLEVAELATRLRRRGGDLLRPSQSASDLAQEAVLRLLQTESTPVFDDPRQLRAYLWKSAWRLLLNRLGKAGRDGDRHLARRGRHAALAGAAAARGEAR
jgi:DNA-directed RNA polymerase specialized sigma24 family protein